MADRKALSSCVPSAPIRARIRVNGRLFREVEFALPRELNEGDQVELAREFASKLTSAGGERLPYTLAVHRGARGRTPTPT